MTFNGAKDDKHHWKCKLFGHTYTKTIPSGCIYFSDNLYCPRCDTWSQDFPNEWYDRWGNGLFVEVRVNLRGLWFWIRGYALRVWRVFFPLELPF